jgi:Fe-S-cluster containining protein
MMCKHHSLREGWFALLAQIYQETEARVSELPCFDYCPDSICERDEKVFFLPFEMEFIAERTGLDLKSTGAFWRLKIPVLSGSADGQSVSIGLKDRHRICPFLNEDNACALHRNRPFDCRSFPLLPTFYSDGSTSFELREYCPLVQVLDLKYFIELYKRLWGFLSPRLPMGWKYLYWHSRDVIPEIEKPDERPRDLNLIRRLAHIQAEMLLKKADQR